jgi:cyanophycinase
LWQISNAGKGDFVVLRTSGDDAYNQWILDLSVQSGKPLNTVRTILMNDAKASSDEVVLNTIRNAEAIFLAGGDQSEYLNYWAGTEVQSIIQAKLTNVTVGGTSAGCAVLGNWVYSGEKGSAVSEEALQDPYDRLITIEPAFLKIPFLDTIITDTHFGEHFL